MKGILAWTVVLSSVALARANSSNGYIFETAPSETNGVRQLTDYTYLDDLSNYSTKFGKCIRVKVKENNNNDGEGNSYFYNGNYHAQYLRYASFFLCTADSNDQCGSCDESTEYVSSLDNYLDQSVVYLKNLCEACANQCGGRGLRHLEEEEEVYDVQVNCNTCKSTCSKYSNDGDANEFNYLDCQKAFVDEESGVQLYSAAACDTSGGMYIGVFYDNECTIKSKKSLDVDFTYNNFMTVETMCTSCIEGNGICDDLYQAALHCSDGANLNANVDTGDMPVCKTYQAASANHTYRKIAKTWKGVPLVMILFLFVGVGFVMGSYTYYIRHQEKKVPMATQDGSTTEEQDKLPELS
jgi:hypothetical protein